MNNQCPWCGREQEYLMIKASRGRARKVCFACGHPLDGSAGKQKTRHEAIQELKR